VPQHHPPLRDATRALVNTYLAHKRLRRSGEIPTGELPERAAELPAPETR